MNFINLRSVFNRKVRAKNPLLFIYKPVVRNGKHLLTLKKITEALKKMMQKTFRSENCIIFRMNIKLIWPEKENI